MAIRTKTPRLEPRPKDVEFVMPPRRIQCGLTRTQIDEEIATVVEHIVAGTPLPDRYYRRNVDNNDDEVLKRTGINHLHLNGQGGDQLLWLIEYSEHVLILEASGHLDYFYKHPPGKALEIFHTVYIRRFEQRISVHVLNPEIARSLGEQPEE